MAAPTPTAPAAVAPTPVAAPAPAIASNLRDQQITLFAQNAVASLSEADFELETDHPITLKSKQCTLVLFYTQNQESRDLAEIWTQVAQVAPGPDYAAVNMILYPRVAQAFTRIGSTNTSLRSFELKGYPFIISYQNGWPIAFFNGERSIGTLADWSTTLACRASYYEPIQLAGGVGVDADFQMGGWREYTPPRQTSIQYTIADPIRQFDAASGVNRITSAQVSNEAPTVEAGGNVAVAPTGGPVVAPTGGVVT